MCGLDHVCSMDVVVVSHVGMVMILQSHHEGNESVRRNLERLEQVTLLQRQVRQNISHTGSVKVKINHLFNICLLSYCFVHSFTLLFTYLLYLRLYKGHTLFQKVC